MYQLLADLVLIVHLMFIVFVVGGGLLALRWPRIAWLHLPTVAWGTLIEFIGGTCPLTLLEKYFLRHSGADPYHGDFISHYLWPLIYPSALTPTIQDILGTFVIVLNAFIYALVLMRMKRHRQNGKCRHDDDRHRAMPKS